MNKSINDFKDISQGISLIIANNPNAVAQNAVAMGLATSYMPAETLFQMVSDLLRIGDIDSIKRLLAVPFNPDAENISADYAFLFAPYKNAKTSDGTGGSSVDWWTVVGSALIGGLSNFVNQSGTGAPNPANPQNQLPTNQPPAQTSSMSTGVIIGLVAFGITIFGLVTYFIVKAAKG